MCDYRLGGYSTGLVCTGAGHPYGHTFASGECIPSQEKSDGGDDEWPAT